MSLQQYALNTAGSARIRLIDMAPDATTIMPHPNGGPDGHRWTPADGSPVELLEMDYSDGATMCEREPSRYRPAQMSDADHAVMVKAFEAEPAAVSGPEQPAGITVRVAVAGEGQL
jgi:hypothetical protein